MEPPALNMKVQANRLIVEGMRQSEEVEGRNYHRVERASGSFRRVCLLAMPVRHVQIQALLKCGRLEVTLAQEE
jgi:HSP20 family molecular chaperone IbpA